MVATNKVKESLITHQEVQKLFSYYPETGEFRKLYRAGKTGCKMPDGYISIEIRGYAYLAHRLAWLYVYGAWPEYMVDHINGVKSDNRIANLRLATNSLNVFSSKLGGANASGVRGVRFHSGTGKWLARIGKDNKMIYLGLFITKEEAAAAYKLKAEELFGQFAEN